MPQKFLSQGSFIFSVSGDMVLLKKFWWGGQWVIWAFKIESYKRRGRPRLGRLSCCCCSFWGFSPYAALDEASSYISPLNLLLKTPSASPCSRHAYSLFKGHL